MNDIAIIPGSALTPLFEQWSQFISTNVHGSTWRNGVGIPDNNVGLDGDYYLDSYTGSVWSRLGGSYSLVTSISNAISPTYSNFASLPLPGAPGRLANISTGTPGVYLDTGTRWVHIAGGVLDAKIAGLKGDGTTESVTAFNAAVSAYSLAGGGVVNFPPGTYVLNSTITAYNNVFYRGYGATISQTTSFTPIFLADGASSVYFEGLTLVGLASDYRNLSSGGSTSACGIKLTGASANSSIKVVNCKFTNFGWSGIFITNVTDLVVQGCTIVGPGSPTIPAGGNNCFGVVVYPSYTRVSIVNNDISGTCQGFFAAQVGTELRIVGNEIHDLPGQHGIYLEHADTFVCTGNIIRNTHFDGLKIQHDLTGAVVSNGQDITVTGNTFVNIPGHPIDIVNLDTSGTHDFYNLNITGNTFDTGTGDDSINLSGCHDVVIEGNTIVGGNRGVRIENCTDVLISGNNIDSCGRPGIAIGETSVGTIDTHRIYARNNIIRNPAQNNVVGYTYGIGLWRCDTVTLDGNIIMDSTGLMTADIYETTVCDSTTLRLRNNRCYGPGIFLQTGQLLEMHDNDYVAYLNTIPSITSGTIVTGRRARTYHGPAIPSGGGPYYAQDIIYNTAPTLGGNVGWICTTGGSPGTWAAFGAIVTSGGGLNSVVSSNATAVTATTSSGVAVFATSTTGNGVSAITSSNYAGYFQAFSGIGVYARQTGTLATIIGNPVLNVLRDLTLNTYDATGALIKANDTALSSAPLLQLQRNSVDQFSIDKVGHLICPGTAPGIVGGLGAGTSPTVSISGSDVGGTISITTGSGPSGTATVATITFNTAYGATPRSVIITPAGPNSAALSGSGMVYEDSASRLPASFVLKVGSSALAGTTLYLFNYYVVG